MSTAGYSGRSLTQKLGIKPGDVVCAINPPPHYGQLLEPLPPGAVVAERADQPAMVHAFVRNTAELGALAGRLVSLPAPGGAVWVSWPKKSSPLFADLTEGGIRQIMLPTGWVDVKVCAVDAEWSGLKFLRRRTPRLARVMK
jgi:hypothetical protein